MPALSSSGCVFTLPSSCPASFSLSCRVPQTASSPPPPLGCVMGDRGHDGARRLGGAQTFASTATPSQPSVVPPHLAVVEYEKTLQGLDPTAPPEKQAKVALDAAIASGDVEQLRAVLDQIRLHIPQEVATLMMHALRTTAVQDNLVAMQFLLAQITGCPPQQVFELLKYALDGAAARESPGAMDLEGSSARGHGMMDFLLGAAQKVFQGAFPEQFLQLVQHAVGAAARRGNSGTSRC
ncbi:unnamed protein product [Prorocentrum cordatum]|uniref:Uncharacterized protein n=1 Tax=Prorocentrum cordatum TaxID=2364126 RepID=A0ABN9XDZ5_9DINO|nr:unnamed protein product [Polarella glacialis]